MARYRETTCEEVKKERQNTEAVAEIQEPQISPDPYHPNQEKAELVIRLGHKIGL